MKPSTRPLAVTLWLSLAHQGYAGVDVNGNDVIVLGDAIPIDEPHTYWSQLEPCPGSCSGNGPEKWMLYTSLDEFAVCSEPLLLDFSLYNPIEPGNTLKLKACNAGKSQSRAKEPSIPDDEDSKATAKRDTGECSVKSPRKTQVNFPVARGDSSSSASDSTLGLLKQFASYLEKDKSCKSGHLFGYANGTVAGVYVGESLGKRSAVSLIDAVAETVKKDGASTLVSQLCGEDRSADEVVGIAINTNGNLAAVQEAVTTWDRAKCVVEQDFGAVGELKDVPIWEQPLVPNNSTNSTFKSNNKLQARADCRTISVIYGDDCGKLAQRCGISGADFTKFNPSSSLCSTLKEEQPVCCSSGTLPDIRPKPNSDGSCATYRTITDDSCSKIAARNGLTQEDLEKFNDGTTWGWNGCDPKLFFAGTYICLSKGNPPMPASVANAVCGPLKPGSTRPTDGTKLEDINPCPLNACCNIWGQCGISGEFCKEGRGPTKNPGTAPKGVNGCVSSCGMDIVNNNQKPSSFGRIGYYESWNFNRPCLHLRAKNANTDGTYTHIHWAFTEINTADWTVKVVDDYKQWDDFKKLPNVKKIISFGGWGYSTLPETYDVLRQAMSPANRAKFAANVASFVNKEGLDGVDFDWEYPGAPDIDGTPPGLPSDGPNYLKFLTTMRGSMARGPNGKSLSIAAPASFWYLKAFPISQMAEQLDYIVYMTYDLHGQWDSGNKWATEGCPEGNCLRSHINATETVIALSMITKAGVPSYKIFVGESSYARSFKMAQAGCTGPDCKYLGTRLNSQAAKGECTGTSGYISDAEIKQIIELHDNVKTFHDGPSNSDIIVYDNTEWAAYMSPATKVWRRINWQARNFAGTIDWAVDLQSFTDDEWSGPGDVSYTDPKAKDRSKCTGNYDKLSDIPSDTPSHCRNLYILQSLRKMLDDTLKNYDGLIKEGYDKKFNTYADAVAQSGNKQIENFMYTKGNDYFKCKVTERYTCCKACYGTSTSEDPDRDCRYCEKFSCDWDPVCTNPEVNCGGLEWRYKDIDMACPPDFSERSEMDSWKAYGHYATAAVRWSFREGKEEKFWADLYVETGMKKEDVTWKSIERYECIPAESDEECQKHDHDHNFPVADGYDKSDVLNPKDVVKDARGKLNDISPQLSSAIDMIKRNIFTGSDYDLVDALSLPISMVADAVDSMQKIDDLVDKWDAQKRKAILLAFLTAIFFLVPVVGEIVGSIATLANIGRIISLIGVAGNVALGVHEIVDNPDNIPLAIFGLILEPLAIFDIAKMSKAASLRRSMSPDDLAKLGATPGSRMDEIKKANDFCALPGKKRDVPVGALPMSSLNGVQYHAVVDAFANDW